MISKGLMSLQSIIRSSALYKWGQRRALATKLRSSAPYPLILATRNTASNVLTMDERRAIADIERVRRSLEENHAEIDIYDYGAGKSNESHSGKRFDEGIIKHQEIAEICKSVSKNQLWCLFLFQLVRHFKPTRCIEMGTCFGISAAYISTALKLNGHGCLITIEGSTQQAMIARSTFHQLGLDNVAVRVGRFQETLVPVLEEMKSTNFVFVDGHHDESATRVYFDIIRQYLEDENVMIFDDIRWSEGMKSAWRHVAAQSDAYDLGPLGVCVNVGATNKLADGFSKKPVS